MLSYGCNSPHFLAWRAVVQGQQVACVCPGMVGERSQVGV